MAAHQCPQCELLFSFRTEVEHHLDTDHRFPLRRRGATKPPTPVDLKTVHLETVSARAPARS